MADISVASLLAQFESSRIDPTQAEQAQREQSAALTIIITAFLIGAVIIIGGYFVFLRLQKLSREKGRREAEEEEQQP